jgi:alpha-L-fucosidase
MRDIGAWLKINGEAIYNTRPISPYKHDNICFTSLGDGTVFAIYLADENESAPPANISLRGIVPAENTRLTLLGSGVPLTWERTPAGSRIIIPKEAQRNAGGEYAWVVKISGLAR